MKSLQLSKPHLLIVIGGPGSGKTTFAERFSDTFHAPFVNARQISAAASSQQAGGWIVSQMINQIQKTNQTLIYEPMTGSRAERSEVAKKAAKAGYKPMLVWLQTDPYVAETRVTKKSRSNPDPLTTDEFIREAKRFTPPNPNEKPVVISGMHTYATQAKVILKKLSEQSDRTNTRPSTPERPSESRPSGQQRRSVTVQ